MHWKLQALMSWSAWEPTGICRRVCWCIRIGAALLAFGIQLSIDYGYGGAIYLKAKTTEIREHYIRDFGAIPFSRHDPFLLLIDGDAARELFVQYLEEE